MITIYVFPMKFNALSLHIQSGTYSKFDKQVDCLRNILTELELVDLPEDQIQSINEQIDYLNSLTSHEKELTKQVRKVKNEIVKSLEKSVKIVPKNYYRNLWMVIGMSAFGLPIGVVFSTIIDNFAFIGVFLPVGMTLGMAMGAQMDEKAKKEGRQLNVEVSM
ncbi:hypothetical protein [Marinoscillum sp.]|uniref:hypothetical protein n=1 Tax=Marinoscillum sp. TaxID=2024838 RepID=UPI003BAD1C09